MTSSGKSIALKIKKDFKLYFYTFYTYYTYTKFIFIYYYYIITINSNKSIYIINNIISIVRNNIYYFPTFIMYICINIPLGIYMAIFPFRK